MVRRSLWFGLRVGVLLGIAFAVAKAVKSRRPIEPAREPWEPIAPRPSTPPAAPSTPAARTDAPPVLTPEPPVEAQIAGEPAAEIEADIEAEEDLDDDRSVEIADALTIEREPQTTGTVAEPEPVTPAAPQAKKAGATATPAQQSAVTSAPKSTERATKKAAKASSKAASSASKTTSKPASKSATPPAAPWVDPDGGVCPQTHPVKAKLASRLFHLPGMFAYDRTRPDRCYLDAAAAEADGFTRSKR